MEEIDKEQLERRVRNFPELESLAVAVIQTARDGNLRNLSDSIHALECYLMDILDWLWCPNCEVFNRAENFKDTKDDLLICPDCGDYQ